jgi:hypothetical protein
MMQFEKISTWIRILTVMSARVGQRPRTVFAYFEDQFLVVPASFFTTFSKKMIWFYRYRLLF